MQVSARQLKKNVIFQHVNKGSNIKSRSTFGNCVVRVDLKRGVQRRYSCNLDYFILLLQENFSKITKSRGAVLGDPYPKRI